MNSPSPQTSTAAPQPPSAARRVVRRLMWALLLTLLLLVGGLSAAWVWAGSAGSLATALNWTQRLVHDRAETWGELSVDEVRGSLRHGGQIGHLAWSLDGLRVEAQDVAWSLDDALWWALLRREALRPGPLRMAQLRIDDQRPERPNEPSSGLPALNLPVALQWDLQVQRLIWRGSREVALEDLRAHYAYDMGLSLASGAPAHRLDLQQLRWAEGGARVQLKAQAELSLAEAWPLRLNAQAELETPLPEGPTAQVDAQLALTGRLAEAVPSLRLQAQAQQRVSTGVAPSLQADVAVRGGDAPGIEQADVRLKDFNLAALWAAAPRTALSGQLQAKPQGQGWAVQADLRNAAPAPADQGGLPLKRVQAHLQQDGERWRLSELQVDTAGGQVRGQAQVRVHPSDAAWQFSDWQGEVQWRQVQLQQWWAAASPMTLDGEADARLLSAPEASPARIAWQVDGRAQPPSTPARIEAAPRLQLQGEWQAPWQEPAAGVLTLRRAQWRGAGVQGQAQGQWDHAQRAWDGQIELQLPGARLDSQGRIAAREGQGDLRWQVSDAAQVLGWLNSLRQWPWLGPQLEASLSGALPHDLAGEAQAQIAWQGGWGAWAWPLPEGSTRPRAWPRLTVDLRVPNLRVQPMAEAAATTLSAVHVRGGGAKQGWSFDTAGQLSRATGAVQWRSAGDLTVSAEDLQTGQLQLSELSLALRPQADALPRARLNLAQALNLDWRLKPGALTLQAAPGALLLSEEGAALAPLRLAWQALAWRDQTLSSQGQLQGLSWPWLQRLTRWAQAADGQSLEADPLAANGVSGDLQLRGEWSLQWPPQAGQAVSLSLMRESGDLRWTPLTPSAASAEPIAAGIEEASLRLSMVAGQTQARLRWRSARMGQATGDLQLPWSASAEQPAPPPATALSGQVDLDFPEVGLWSALSPPGWRVMGRIAARVAIAGTVSAPQWQGELQADDLAVRSSVNGLSFDQGRLRATLSQQGVQLQAFSLQGAGGEAVGGRIEATGHAQWSPGAGLDAIVVHLEAQAQRLRVSNQVDRRLTLSGDVTADLQGQVLRVRGAVVTDAARIVLPDEFAPRLGEDVIVRGTRALTPSEEARRVKPDVQLSFDFGERFTVSGQGMETRLAGAVTLRATPDDPTPSVVGEVRTVDGTYRAYGQKLAIETGVLRFTGPSDDPALDILALRAMPRDSEQQVGVKVSGSAQAPRVSLYAAPDLPDVDKLAWLVLGRPASAAGAQSFVLQQALRNVMANSGAPTEGGLADALQLDSIGLEDRVDASDPEATQTALVLGKRVSDRLYLSYERTLSGTMSTVSMLYQLSRRFTLRARTGTENAVDLIFTLQYR